MLTEIERPVEIANLTIFFPFCMPTSCLLRTLFRLHLFYFPLSPSNFTLAQKRNFMARASMFCPTYSTCSVHVMPERSLMSAAWLTRLRCFLLSSHKTNGQILLFDLWGRAFLNTLYFIFIFLLTPPLF